MIPTKINFTNYNFFYNSNQNFDVLKLLLKIFFIIILMKILME